VLCCSKEGRRRGEKWGAGAGGKKVRKKAYKGKKKAALSRQGRKVSNRKSKKGKGVAQNLWTCQGKKGRRPNGFHLVVHAEREDRFFLGDKEKVGLPSLD